MARYSVYFETVASTRIEVEADNSFEAEDLAAEKLPTICAQCAGWGVVDGIGIDLGDWEVDETEVEDEEEYDE